ncbi:MAG: NusG domain II-containing protein [Lachnospiraceae bacterium]|nr:NusG domain II-containing protein [Lachnospiraceae bacterium]
MKKADIILLTVLLFVTCLAFIVISHFKKSNIGRTVVIEIDGREYERVSLSDDKVIRIPTDSNDSVLVINKSSCYMESADCPDKICVRRGAIEKVGESIICVPKKIVVYIE